MMTGLQPEEPAGFLCMRLAMAKKKKNTEIIYAELFSEARQLIKEMDEDVEIYNKFKMTTNIKRSLDADKFVAWWDLKCYVKYPHSLIFLFENVERIQNVIGQYNMLDGFEQLQMKMALFYGILKKHGMIYD